MEKKKTKALRKAGNKPAVKIGDKFRLYKTGPWSRVTAIANGKVDFETIIKSVNIHMTGSCPISIYLEYKKAS